MPEGLNQAATLRKRRDEITKKASAMLVLGEKEDRDLTTEEQTEFDARHAEANGLLARIERIERQEGLDASVATSLGTKADGDGGNGSDGGNGNSRDGIRVGDALDHFIRRGVRSMSAELRSAVSAGDGEDASPSIEINLRTLRDEFLSAGRPVVYRGISGEERSVLRSNLSASELRAMGVGVTSGGLETVAQGFWPAFVEAMLAFGGVRNVANVFTTSKGGDLPVATIDDTSQKGVLLTESTEADEQDIATSSVTFKAYKFSSKIVRMSVELLQDSEFDVGGLAGRLLGIRIARILADYFTTGTNTNEPEGIVTGSVAGPTTASATAVAWSEMVGLKHSVDPAYRDNGLFGYNDTTLLALKQLLDGDNRPLWQASVQVGTPDRIDGDGTYINQSMADIASTTKAVIYGAHDNFWVRDVLGFTLSRLVERFAEKHQVGLVGIARSDSKMVNAGTAPIKHLLQAT